MNFINGIPGVLPEPQKDDKKFKTDKEYEEAVQENGEKATSSISASSYSCSMCCCILLILLIGGGFYMKNQTAASAIEF